MIYETEQSKGAADLAAYYLQNGKGTHAYRYFGVHRILDRQGWWYEFRVAAPGADAVSLVGEFNNWEPVAMQRQQDSGVWVIAMCTEICPEGLRYKYRIQKGERIHDKADPYARMSESSGEGASYICTESHYVWQDAGYLAGRADKCGDRERYSFPLNVYEVYPSCWLGSEAGSYSEAAKPVGYRMLADLLAQYAADMGYTHVLFPSPALQGDARQGISAYFAPDSALGSPDDFAYLIDRMHKEGIGVIIELCCQRPGKHAAGLCDFDFCGLYSKATGQERHFDYADPYTTTLLYSSALFWLREFHVDGLYLNTQGMHPDRTTGAFVRGFSSAVRSGMQDVLLLLRASGYRGLSTEQSLGGLGYDFVIDPHTEQSLLDCFAMSAELRLGRKAWCVPMQRMYTENAVLGLSSALCAQQAGSVMGSLQGTHAQAFAAMRALLLFVIGIPGKKLLFMGNEIGQPSPANAGNGVEWFLRELPDHEALRNYVKSLNRFYLSTPALWECDCTRDGFCSVECENAPEGIVAFKRFDRAGHEVCAVFNFAQDSVRDVRLALGGRYPYYTCAFGTKPDLQPARFQTDAQGYATLDLDGLCGMLLIPDAPKGGFWFENV